MWPNPQILAVWSDLLKKFLMENLIFCAVNTVRKLCKKFGFCYERHNKKCKYIMLKLFLQFAALLKMRLRHRRFLVSFEKIFSQQI